MRLATRCVLFCALFGVQLAFGQIPNGEFDNMLYPWWGHLQNSDIWTIKHGTFEWSSNYGGSAHMTVSGAPSQVGLLNFTNGIIHADDTIRVRLYHSNFGNFSCIHFYIGGVPPCGQEPPDHHQDSGPGPCYIDLVADREYPCGTPVWFHFVAFPGNAEAWIGRVWVIQTAPEEVGVELDIKPGSCPNPLNVKSKGKLPVAVLGNADLDVTDVDVSTIELVGVAPIRSEIEDVAAPVENKQDPCDCVDEGADGHDDLTLRFDTQGIVEALGEVEDSQEIELTLIGELVDGTPIEGTDCVLIIKKGKGGKQLAATNPLVPQAFALGQSYPNPGKEGIAIEYVLPMPSQVSLKMFDVTGSLVKTLEEGEKASGHHIARWSGLDEAGRQVPNGVYFYELRADEYRATGRMALVR